MMPLTAFLESVKARKEAHKKAVTRAWQKKNKEFIDEARRKNRAKHRVTKL